MPIVVRPTMFGTMRMFCARRLRATSREIALIFATFVSEGIEFFEAPDLARMERFRDDFRGSAGLFGELFGMGSRYRMVAIEKDGRVVEIGAALENVQGYTHYNVQFLGWIDVE